MINRFKCFLGFHDFRIEYAKNREADTCHTQYRTEEGEWVMESADGCTLVEVCQDCGGEDEMKAPASVADRNDLWE